jgi:hypothetical protein
MQQSQSIPTPVSPGRLRLGILMFILWWLPVYLMVPAVTDALGEHGNAHAIEVTTAVIVLLQTVIGLIGVFLLGKTLALTLKQVTFKKLPATIWHIAWTGKATIDPTALKAVKHSPQSR